jgi:hypothetical protein
MKNCKKKVCKKNTTFTSIFRVKKCYFHHDMQKIKFFDFFISDWFLKTFKNFLLDFYSNFEY